MSSDSSAKFNPSAQPSFTPALILLGLAIVINYVDRGNLSIAAPIVQTELRLTRAWHGERLAPLVFYRRHAEIAEALEQKDYARAEALVAALIDEGEARLRDQLGAEGANSGRSVHEVGPIRLTQHSVPKNEGA